MENTEKTCWKTWLRDACGDEAIAGRLLPHGRADDPWSPEAADVDLAWIFFSELRTRVTTQHLPLRDGDESTALKSIVDFFKLARSAIAGHPNSHHSSTLIAHSLNVHVRPFTSKWHALEIAKKMQSLDQRFHFRADLASLQVTLRALTKVFGQMAGDNAAAIALELDPPASPSTNSILGKLRYGIPESGPRIDQIKDLNAAEAREIQARRNLSRAQGNEVNDAVGLAISGGGIRSATFALGIVEVLSERGILSDVDVMSTVSGGGYLGSFISSVTDDSNPDIGLKAGQLPFRRNNGVESPLVRHLRNHSKYLSEGGLSTLALIVFSAAYGVLMSLLLIAPYLVLAALFAVSCFGFGAETSAFGFETNLWGKRFALAGLGLAVFLLSISRNRSSNERNEKFAVGFFILLLALLAGEQLRGLFDLARDHIEILLGCVVALPLLFGVVGLWWGPQRIAGRIALGTLAIVGPLFFICTWFAAVEVVMWLRSVWEYAPWVAAILLVVYGVFGININFASIHLYYRNRLVRTYLRKNAQNEPNDPLKLSALNGESKAPLHLINATLNVPKSLSSELRGRDADFFTFSKVFCGGPLVGWWPTAQWEAADSHLDLGTAMAISGAAAAPRMGTLTSARYTTLLAMLNVRLGYWLHRPGVSNYWNRVPGAFYFVKELLGTMDERSPLVNLSDGGHIENLGLYELLRRRCRYIIVIDGEADPEHRFGGLLSSIQMAKIDLGVKVEPDLNDLRLGDDRFKRAHFAMTRIDYGLSEGGQKVYGLLFVIKLAMTGNESEVLMKYQQDNPSFPHQSTAQQLFNESQFEAYRALGEHAAEAAFDSLLVGHNFKGAVQWLCELEKRLIA